MNSKLTLQTLPLDCLLHILSYVPLPECMSLRSSCARLKTAVDEHFRISVHKLPVLLSTREEKPAAKYLWCENYLIVRDTGDFIKYGKFINFITKYLPKITKLKLIVDDDFIFMLELILDVYKSQLKVLTSESFDYSEDSNNSIIAFGSASLPNLEELRISKLEFSEVLFSLNKFPKLKRIHFKELKLDGGLHTYRGSVTTIRLNSSVEFIEIDKLSESSGWDFLCFFKNVKKVIVWEPSIELNDDDFPLSNESIKSIGLKIMQNHVSEIEEYVHQAGQNMKRAVERLRQVRQEEEDEARNKAKRPRRNPPRSCRQ